MFAINKCALIFLCVLLFSPLQSFGACRLPIPDGGGEGYTPSGANLFGDIVRVKLPVVTIKNGETHRLEKVSLSKIDAIYSVYGGDGPLSDLKPGMQVWVWFEMCKRPAQGIPAAAYFEFFSTNPADRAKLDHRGRIISVPQ